MSRRDVDVRSRVDRIVEKFLGFSEPVLAATALTCLNNGYDKKKTAEKLGNLLDSSKAERLAEKIISLAEAAKELKSSRKRHHDDDEDSNNKKSKSDKKSDILSANEIKNMMANAQKMIEERKKSLNALKSSPSVAAQLKPMPKTLPTILSSSVPSMQRSGGVPDEKAKKIAMLQAQIKNKLSSGVLGLDAAGLPLDKPTPLILDSEGRTVDSTGREVQLTHVVPTLKNSPDKHPTKPSPSKPRKLRISRQQGIKKLSEEKADLPSDSMLDPCIELDALGHAWSVLPTDCISESDKSDEGTRNELNQTTDVEPSESVVKLEPGLNSISDPLWLDIKPEVILDGTETKPEIKLISMGSCKEWNKSDQGDTNELSQAAAAGPPDLVVKLEPGLNSTPDPPWLDIKPEVSLLCTDSQSVIELDDTDSSSESNDSDQGSKNELAQKAADVGPSESVVWIKLEPGLDSADVEFPDSSWLDIEPGDNLDGSHSEPEAELDGTDSGSDMSECDLGQVADNVGYTNVGVKVEPGLNCTSHPSWLDVKPEVSSFSFTGTPGLKVLPPGSDPIHYFGLLANPEFFELVLSKTNKYADQLMKTDGPERARIKQWKALTITELTKFLGIFYLMGHVVMPSEYHYWRKVFPYNFPTISSVMSRDRFITILRCLYFADCESVDPEADPINKIKPLLDWFQETMEKLYSPERDMCISEWLLLRQGKLSIPKSNTYRRHTDGIKLYMLIEPDGLVLKTYPITCLKERSLGGKGHSFDVVKNLVNGRLGMGHSVYTSSYYTSLALCHKLLEEQTYLTGVLNRNEGDIPATVSKTKLSPGEVVEKFSNKGVSIFKWRQKYNDILMLSSEFQAEMHSIMFRGKPVSKPNAYINYNLIMGVINRRDLLTSYYPLEKKNLRWFVKLGTFVFQLMMINSYKLFQFSTGSQMKLLDFRDRVIVELLGGVPSPGPPPQLSMGVHLPSRVPHNRKKRCRICYSLGKRKDVRFVCNMCPDIPGLCIEPCFRILHNYP